MKGILSLLIIAAILQGCGKKNSEPVFVASTPVITSIIQEIAGNEVEVQSLLPAGASPHTFSMKPSDMKKMESARAVFYVSSSLDAWALGVKMDNKIALLDLIPKEFQYKFEDGNTVDPHFWTDPLTVKALIPGIVKQLSKHYPEANESFLANAKKFAARLDTLHIEVQDKLCNIKGSKVFLFHPSFRYFLKRYTLTYAGSVEPMPGKEPTPSFIASFIDSIKASGVKTIFSEPQFNEVPVKSIAEAAGVNVMELDPIGGTDKRNKYVDLILYNADILKAAFEK